MPHRLAVSAALILLGSLLWTGRLLFGSSPWGTQGEALLAIGLLLATAVNVVAMLLAPGKWVRNAIAVVSGVQALTAIALPVDLVWGLALATQATGVALAWTRPVEDWFHPVKPDRVPAKATSLALGLIWLPAAVGGLGIPEVTPAGWVMAVFGLVVGWAYARAVRGALWTVRLALLPIGGLSLIGLWWPAGVGILAAALTLTLLAWTADARLAVRTPVPRRVKPFSVLPEMTPPGLMESAGYDRRGRPIRRSD